MTIEKSVLSVFSRILSVCLLSAIASVPIAIAQESSYSETYGEPPNENCTFPELELPENFDVYATVAYTGQQLSRQIDQSGQQARQIDVVVNSPSQPVVLMLGAYDPAIWDIQWTEGTNIVGVLASGYHHQAIAGLPEETPLLTSTFDNKGECGYFYDGSGADSSLEHLSRRLFGPAVKKQFSQYRLSSVVIGEPLGDSPKLLSSDDTPVESFFNEKRH